MIQNKKMFPQKYCCDIQYKVVPPQLFIVLLFYIPDYLSMYMYIYVYICTSQTNWGNTNCGNTL